MIDLGIVVICIYVLLSCNISEFKLPVFVISVLCFLKFWVTNTFRGVCIPQCCSLHLPCFTLLILSDSKNLVNSPITDKGKKIKFSEGCQTTHACLHGCRFFFKQRSQDKCQHCTSLSLSVQMLLTLLKLQSYNACVWGNVISILDNKS